MPPPASGVSGGGCYATALVLSHEGILFLFASVIWFKFSFFLFLKIGLLGNQTAMGLVFFFFFFFFLNRVMIYFDYGTQRPHYNLRVNKIEGQPCKSLKFSVQSNAGPQLSFVAPVFFTCVL